MRILPLISAGFCVLIAFYMPSDLARPVEINTVSPKPTKPVEALQQTKFAEAQVSAIVEVEAPTVATVQPGEPSNSDKAYVYAHESGNNPSAVNEIGCRGLGQACPGSKLPCGNDYACQDAWFTNYAMERYGSWANARIFWQQNHWW